jgi:DNA invertase Pin-like site-specific DNA recombinase
MAKIGYARVSTRGQNDDSQVDDLTAYGCEKIFTDTASGKHAARPELDKAWPTSARATSSSSPGCPAPCGR